MTKEAKLGLLVIITTFFSIWGYKFIKGKDLFSKSYEYKTVYKDITGLAVSSPVMINGFKVGTVTEVKLNEQNVESMIITMSLDDDYKIPSDAYAVQFNDGIVGGKAIAIEFDKICSNNCLENGGTLRSKNRGMLTSMLGTDNLDGYIETANKEFNNTISNLGGEGQDGQIHEMVRNINSTMNNLAQLTNNLNNMVLSNNKNIAGFSSNLNTITQGLADNNENISQLIKNLTNITNSINKADIGESTASTMTEAKNALTQLNTTLESTESTMKKLDNVLEKVDTGDGSLAKLLNDQLLYDNLEFTSRNLGLLLQDLRLNPKRYVNVSVFGRKAKDFKLPEDDPAFND